MGALGMRTTAIVGTTTTLLLLQALFLSPDVDAFIGYQRHTTPIKALNFQKCSNSNSHDCVTSTATTRAQWRLQHGSLPRTALRTPSPIHLSSTGASSNDSQQDDQSSSLSIRDKLRKLSGFSFTAFRATVRAATGFSLTALRTSLRAATGISITTVMKQILGIFPSWARYFMQPLLILYYSPLMILRSFVGPTKDSRSAARQAHEHFVEEWKNAVKVAEAVNNQGYWPVHVNEEGLIVALPPDPDGIIGGDDMTSVLDGVANSVEVAESISQSGIIH